MTDHPCLEVPFDVVTKWEEIEGSCASFYAAAEWGYKQALATPPPLAPNYIDPEHHGEDRELLQVFYAACNAEGGTADEIHLRGIKAVMAGRATLEATPPPKPPNWREPMTQPNFRALCAELVDELNYHADEHSVDKLIDRARAALATSPPEPPTIMEILTLIDEIDEARLGQIDLVRAALERWGQR